MIDVYNENKEEITVVVNARLNELKTSDLQYSAAMNRTTQQYRQTNFRVSQYSGKSLTSTEHSGSGKDLTGALLKRGREAVDDTAAVSAEREVCLQAPSQVSSTPPHYTV